MLFRTGYQNPKFFHNHAARPEALPDLYQLRDISRRVQWQFFPGFLSDILQTIYDE